MPLFNNNSQQRRRVSRVISLFVLGVGSISGLFGQDFFGAGVSAQTAARAGIYIPSADNALDALSLNPAGLSALSGTVVDISALGLLARGNFSNASNNDSSMRLSGGVVPYGAIGVPLGGRWTIGAGFMPDLLSSARWQFRDSPGVAGADYGLQNEKSQIQAFRSTAGVAYRISSRISAGATVGAIYNSNTLIMPYVFQSQPQLKGLKTLLDLHTTGVGWNTSFGVTARVSSRWELGASFRTRSSITSTGGATGNMGAQFAALQIPFSPAFSYRAQVAVQVPQAALLNATWRKSPVLRLSVESTWTNWKGSFAALPVSLSNGTNSDINGFLQSSGIKDVIPLAWKDQFSFRAAAERKIGESFSVSGGYVYQNSPVPSSTLLPLTAVIMKNGLTTGAGFNRGRARFDVAYQLNLTAEQSVGVSGLLSGEFSQSRVHIGTQALTLSTSFHL